MQPLHTATAASNYRRQLNFSVTSHLVHVTISQVTCLSSIVDNPFGLPVISPSWFFIFHGFLNHRNTIFGFLLDYFYFILSGFDFLCGSCTLDMFYNCEQMLTIFLADAVVRPVSFPFCVLPPLFLYWNRLISFFLLSAQFFAIFFSIFCFVFCSLLLLATLFFNFFLAGNCLNFNRSLPSFRYCSSASFSYFSFLNDIFLTILILLMSARTVVKIN